MNRIFPGDHEDGVFVVLICVLVYKEKFSSIKKGKGFKVEGRKRFRFEFLRP